MASLERLHEARFVISLLSTPGQSVDTVQRGRFCSPMCYCFRMECRRWAPICDGWISRFFVFLVEGRWIDGWGLAPWVIVGMRVREMLHMLRWSLTWDRIVEYATRDQAQNAVSTLSNQNLMGRLVYVREVSCPRGTLPSSSEKVDEH